MGQHYFPVHSMPLFSPLQDTPRLWPQPSSVPVFNGTRPSLLLSAVFTIEHGEVDVPSSDILSYNMKLYRELLFARAPPTPATGTKPATHAPSPSTPPTSDASTSDKPLLRLVVSVTKDAVPSDYPHLGMDESYEVTYLLPSTFLPSYRAEGGGCTEIYLYGVDCLEGWLGVVRGVVPNPAVFVVRS